MFWVTGRGSRRRVRGDHAIRGGRSIRQSTIDDRFADVARLAESTLTLGPDASAFYDLGWARRATGSPTQALAAYDQALTLCRAAHDRGNEAATLNSLGAVYDGLGGPVAGPGLLRAGPPHHPGGRRPRRRSGHPLQRRHDPLRPRRPRPSHHRTRARRRPRPPGRPPRPRIRHRHARTRTPRTIELLTGHVGPPAMPVRGAGEDLDVSGGACCRAVAPATISRLAVRRPVRTG